MDILISLGFALLALGKTPPLIQPSFLRNWTQVTGDNTSVIAVQNKVIYYRSSKGIGALDLVSGQKKWSALPHQRFWDAALQGKTLYAVTRENSALFALDIESGQSRILAKFPASAESLAITSERLFVLDESATLWAYKLNGGPELWRRKLQSKTLRASSQLIATQNGLYVGLDESGDFGIDPKNGAVLWTRRTQYAGLYRPLVTGNDIITQHSNFRRMNIRTGKAVWAAGDSYGDAVMVANVLIAPDRKHLVGRDVTNGHILWRIPLRDADASYMKMETFPVISDSESIWIDRQPFLCVTKDGHERWMRTEPFTGTPVYADNTQVVTTDGERILSYVAGTLPPLPATDDEQRVLAERLTAQ